MLFHQLIPSKKVEISETGDCFGQLREMVATVFKREVPSINSMSHLLYHANIKIQQYAQAAEYHRKRIDLSTAVGLFHQEAYEIALKKGHQLQRLMDSYILLHIEEERENVNHRLRLVDDKIEKLFMEYQNKDNLLPELEEKFWQAFKEDLIPILAELK
ncbi:MAG: hypothetical protein C0P75_001015 [Bacilli bacterium]|jgi:hypothetical protein|uniref:Uncharacterized protein n=1 Tax=Ureibacillus suwonensis TaxID=313007 RepID=A0ABW0RBF9_9BACL|nr:hypothetical protein [Bacilli bacterium]